MEKQEPTASDFNKVKSIYKKLMKEKDDLESECSILTDILTRKHSQNVESMKGKKHSQTVENMKAKPKKA